MREACCGECLEWTETFDDSTDPYAGICLHPGSPHFEERRAVDEPACEYLIVLDMVEGWED